MKKVKLYWFHCNACGIEWSSYSKDPCPCDCCGTEGERICIGKMEVEEWT